MNKLIFLDIPLFADLSRVHKAALLQEFTQLSYRKGDLLFEEGEFGDSLYIIMQGQARIYLSSAAGGKTTLAILGEKEYFGEMALLTGDPRSASAMAESDLVVLRLVKESFDRILLEHNALAVQFAGILARRLARVNRQSSQAASSQEESGEAKALTSGGALREDAVAEERPGEQRERLDQRDQSEQGERRAQKEQGEQREGAGADAASRRSPQVRALGAVISLVAGMLLYAAMQTSGQPTAAAALTGTGLTALLLTACGVVSPLLAAMLMAASAVSLPGIGLGGGISASFVYPLLTALALAMSAQAVYRTGVAQRLLLRSALRLQASGVRPGSVIGLMSLLTVWMLPSSRLRSEAFALLQLTERERQHAAAYPILLLQSSGLCWFAAALLPGSLTDREGFIHWMITAWPLAAVLLLIHLILPLLKREDERLAPDPSIMSAQLSVMGNLSAKETAALIVMLGGGLAMTLAYWLGLSLLGVSLLMVLALSACGLLTKAVARGVSYEPFIMFALLASAAGLYEEAGLQRLTAGWISQHMSAAGALVALFALVSLLARFVPPMLAIFAGLTALGCGSVEAGASGAQAAVAAVLAAQWPISLPVAKKLWSPAVPYRVLSASLALLVAVYVWHWTGAGDERRPPVSKSVMATAGGPAALEVPIAVQLPHDALAAASVKQGVELAVADAQLSSVSPPMQLWPDYRGSGEAGRSGGAAPVFAIAAAESDSASAVRRELPTLLLDGAASAGGLSVALAPAPEAYAGEVADLLLDRSLNKVAVYYEDSVPGRQFAAALEQEAERRGIGVVDRLAAISGRSALTDAIVRWKLLEAQAVAVYDGSGGVAPELSTGLTQAGALYPLFVGPSLPGADVLAAYKGEVYGYTDLDAKTGRTEAEAFAERYRSAYGAEPSRLAAAAYDAARLIAQSAGLAAAAEPARMREAMARIGAWEGAVRRYTFTPLQGGGGDNGASVHIVSLTPEPTPKTPKSGTTGRTKR